MSTRPALLRSLGLTPDGSFPANTMPAELTARGVSGPRNGGPLIFCWRVVYVDASGAAVTGGTTGAPDTGSATVQWYSVAYLEPTLPHDLEAGAYAYRAQPAIRSQVLGSAAVATGGAAEVEKTITGRGYPWPRVTAMTPPAVLAKQIRVLVGGGADGTYRLQVNSGANHAYSASSKTATQIRTALLALINDAEVVAIADPDNVAAILLTSAVVGTSFTVNLASTGSALTQTEVQDNRQPAVGLNVYMIIDRPPV